MTAEELFALAAQKLEQQGQCSMTNLELGLETISKHLMGSELQRRLEMPESPASRKCSNCGKRSKIRARNKARTIRTR